MTYYLSYLEQLDCFLFFPIVEARLDRLLLSLIAALTSPMIALSEPYINELLVGEDY